MKGKLISENAYALILCITSKVDRETALKSCGIEIPFSQRGATIKPTLIPKEDKDKIHDWYYNKNMTLNDIGKIYDVSPVTVKNFLVKMGIPIKQRGRYIK
jgi:hypothetical protein